MKTISMTSVEKREFMEYLNSAMDARVYPTGVDQSAVTRQGFRRKAERYIVEQGRIFVVHEGLRKEVICRDEPETIADIIRTVHDANHKGRNSDWDFISQRYCGIPRALLDNYIGSCIRCNQFEPIQKI